MKMIVALLVCGFAYLVSRPALALETVKVTDGIYAFVGEKQQRSPQNLANNSTHGLIVTPEGAVLVDPGVAASRAPKCSMRRFGKSPISR